MPSWSDRSRVAALAVASLASALAGLLLGIAVLTGVRPPLALVGLGIAIVARVGLAPVLVATSVAFMLLAVVGAPMLARTLRVNAGR